MKTLVFYAKNNRNLGRAYLAANGIKRIEIGRHHLGGRGFQAWLMTSEKSGFSTGYTRKRDAMADAKICADAFGLSVSH